MTLDYGRGDAAVHDSVAQRLEATFSIICAIQKLFQSPSFSIGVLHRGEVILTKGFGFSDKATGRVPDENTVYSIGSCTKAFTATALSLLEQRGKVDWKEPVSTYLPEFKTPYSPVVGEKATLPDILSHSTGLDNLPYSVVGRNGSVFAKHEEVVHICSGLPYSAEFRSEWKYNNWLYALAGYLVAKESGETWGQFVSKNILEEFHLGRTYTTYPVDDNYARAYVVFDDGSSHEADLPSLIDNDAFDSSGCLRSCVKDLLTWSSAIMKASSTVGSVRETNQGDLFPVQTLPSEELSKDLLKAISVVEQPHFPLTTDPDQAYALGLFSYRIPTEEINVSTNIGLITTPYRMGADSPPRKVIGHTGELGSFLSAYWTFPESESAVVVLTNSFSVNGDPTNLVAQVLIQAIFDLTPKIDYIKVASEVVSNAKLRWEKTVDDWTSNRTPGTHPRSLKTYEGIYYSTDLRITICITINEGNHTTSGSPIQLQLRINGLKEQTFQLYHYHCDSWTFLPETRDGCRKRGLTGYIGAWKAFIVSFSDCSDGCFRSLTWALGTDSRVQPQQFKRVQEDVSDFPLRS